MLIRLFLDSNIFPLFHYDSTEISIFFCMFNEIKKVSVNVAEYCLLLIFWKYFVCGIGFVSVSTTFQLDFGTVGRYFCLCLSFLSHKETILLQHNWTFVVLLHGNNNPRHNTIVFQKKKMKTKNKIDILIHKIS